jgi:hypothetical protein
MFCPECKAEYLPGVTHCSDCDVDLVDSLAESDRDSDGLPPDAELRSVWSGGDEQICTAVCAQLKAAAISFRVNQSAREFLTRLEQHFEIGVPADVYAQAKEIIHSDGSDSADNTNDTSVLELPAEDDEDDPVETTDEWDSKDWNPEDATAEIWSGGGEEQALVIESCLREVNIRARVESTDGGRQQVFVLPNDESRAKEIVREIDEATPPA